MKLTILLLAILVCACEAQSAGGVEAPDAQAAPTMGKKEKSALVEPHADAGADATVGADAKPPGMDASPPEAPLPTPDASPPEAPPTLYPSCGTGVQPTVCGGTTPRFEWVGLWKDGHICGTCTRGTTQVLSCTTNENNPDCSTLNRPSACEMLCVTDCGVCAPNGTTGTPCLVATDCFSGVCRTPSYRCQ